MTVCALKWGFIKSCTKMAECVLLRHRGKESGAECVPSLPLAMTWKLGFTALQLRRVPGLASQWRESRGQLSAGSRDPHAPTERLGFPRALLFELFPQIPSWSLFLLHQSLFRSHLLNETHPDTLWTFTSHPTRPCIPTSLTPLSSLLFSYS